MLCGSRGIRPRDGFLDAASLRSWSCSRYVFLTKRLVPKIGFVLSSLKQERSTKSHETGTKKAFVSCGFVDLLTWREDFKIGHYQERAVLTLLTCDVSIGVAKTW